MSVPANDVPPAPSWAEVLALVSRLDASGLEDAEVVLGGLSVRVSKSELALRGPSAPSAAVGPVPAAAAKAPAREPRTTAQEATGHLAVPSGPAVTAPMLGVLYLRPSPEAAPFVSVGDTVTPDTTVAIIEVMKLMNNVTAGAEGTVAEVCGEEGQTVEYGDVLFRLQAAR